MTRTIVAGLLVLLCSLIFSYVFIIYVTYSTLIANSKTTTDILGVDIFIPIENWFEYNYFLKLNVPGDKHYYISNLDGIIERGKDIDLSNTIEVANDFNLSNYYEYEEDSNEEHENQTYGLYSYYDMNDINVQEDSIHHGTTIFKRSLPEVISPYISFVSLNHMLFDIFFKSDGNPYIIESNQTSLIPTFTLIRHHLDSFVGPDSKVYRVVYNNDNASDITITEVRPFQHLNHLQIKTFGPYCKWEHTYIFSTNGLRVTSHFISPVERLQNRSIPLPYSNNQIMDQAHAFLQFNTPNGRKYVITKDLDIVLFHGSDDERNFEEPFISFTGQNSRKYDIHFHGHHPSIEDVGLAEDFYGSSRLISFVGPSNKFYHIKQNYISEIPILVPEPNDELHKNLKITVAISDDYRKYYNKFVTYTFGNDGMHLIDREDELDWTPLSEQESLYVEEIDDTSDITSSSFLIFYSPSGKNYHMMPTNTSEPNIVVETVNKNSSSPYITFKQENGRVIHIHISPYADPYIAKEEFGAAVNSSYQLLAFVTPYKKSYDVVKDIENNHEILLTKAASQGQSIDPLDEKPVNSLTIQIWNTFTEYTCEFSWTWSGDKLLSVSLLPLKIDASSYIPTNVVQSLIGGGVVSEKIVNRRRKTKKSATNLL